MANEISESELSAWYRDVYLNSVNRDEERASFEQMSPSDQLAHMKRRYQEEHPNQGELDNGNDVITEPERTSNYQQNFTSDEWQQLISGENTDFLNETAPIRKGIDRAILQEMNKLPDNFADLDADAQQDAINVAKANLKADERQEFNQKDIELKKEILEYYPPQRLVYTSEWLEEAEKSASTDEIRQDMESSRAALMEVMVSKVNKYANGETIVDQTNIADVYDGAMEMYKYVEEKNPDDDALKQNIEKCRTNLNKEIDIYDEENGFATFEERQDENGDTVKVKVSELTNSDAHEINETFLRAQEQAKNEEKIKNPPEELAQVWENIEFAENDSEKRNDFINSFNDAVIKKATMNVAVKNKGQKGDELDTALQEEINKVYAAELTAMLTANEAAKHLAQEEQKRQANPSYVPQPMTEEQAKIAGQTALDAIFNGKGEKYKVDNKVQTANFARYTNNAFGYLNRLGTKIGKKTNAVGNMAESVKDFDKTCIKRFDPYYSIARTQLMAMGCNMGRQALNQVVRYGSSLVPGGNIVYGAYVGGQAAWRLITKHNRLKKEAKKNNRKFSTLGFLKDHAAEIATSALATGAAFFAGSYGATVAGYAAMAVGNITNAWKTIKRQREKGESWTKSFSVGLFSSALSTGTALGTSYGLGLGMEAAGLDATSSAVTDNKQIEELKNLNDEQLSLRGITREHNVSPESEGAFLVQEAKDAYTTRDYTQDELDYAKHRMEKVFDENDTHTGGTRYSEHLERDWTDKAYADNPEAYKNAISSIDELAKTHPEMHSEIDGVQKSNSDMLLYKLYQANILAPNPDAISDSGQPIREVLSYTDENGTTTYQDTYNKLLNGVPLTEADAKVLQIVEDHVGGQYAEGTNDMGKLKDFNNLGNGSNPDSYNKDANIGYELNEHKGQEAIYDRFIEETKRIILPLTMVHDNQGENRSLAKRIGANAKEATEKKQPEDYIRPQPPFIPVPKKDEDEVVVVPEEQEKKVYPEYIAPEVSIEEIKKRVQEKIHKNDTKPGYGKLLADEYKIVYGVAPQVVDRGTENNPDKAYQSWISYNNRVDAERQATGRDIDMYDFLVERRAEFDKLHSSLSDNHYTTVGRKLAIKDGRPVLDEHGKQVSVPYQVQTAKDYQEHKDNPSMAAIVAQEREIIQKSNLTTENYTEKMTLSHFTQMANWILNNDDRAGIGSQDIVKNPTFKRRIFEAGKDDEVIKNPSHVKIFDMNVELFDDAGKNAAGAKKGGFEVASTDHGIQLAMYELRDHHYPEEHNKLKFEKKLRDAEKARKDRLNKRNQYNK